MNTEVSIHHNSASSNIPWYSQGDNIDDKLQRNGSELKPGRSVLLVLGMHRSGTSALTRTLSLLGVDLPKNLMPPVQENNEAGFWESMDVYHLNDEILRAGGSHWSDWTRFQQENLSPAEKKVFKDNACDVINRNFGKSNLFVLKDPRICRLLNLWLEVFTTLSIQPLCVLPIRHPLEVAASIKRRDGINEFLCQALWLRHVLDAEKGSRGLPRTFCSYDELIIDWRAMTDRMSDQLGIIWPIKPDNASQLINEFLQPRLRHFSMADGRAVIPSDQLVEWCESAYSVFQDIIQFGDSIKSRNELDSIGKNFENACKLIRLPDYNEVQNAANHPNLSEELMQDFNDLQKDAFGYEGSCTEGSELKSKSLHRDTQLKNLKDEVDNLKQDLDKSKQIQNALLYRLNAIQATEAWALMRPLMFVEKYIPILVRAPVATAKILWWALTFRLPRRLAIRRQGLKLIRSGHFDYDWYIQKYPEVVLQGFNPVLHWLTQGWYQGYQPNSAHQTDGFVKLLHNPDRLGADVIISYLESQGNPTANAIHTNQEFNPGISSFSDIHKQRGKKLIKSDFISRSLDKSSDFISRHSVSPYSQAFNAFAKSWKKQNSIEWARINVPYSPGLVSIILPSYNGETMIREALDSILSQTYQNFELIAINDGSIDETGRILDEYARLDQRIKVFHQENKKLPKTLSIGIRKSKGEYITWTSVDNRLKPHFIQEMVDSLSRNPGWDMVFANMDIIGDDGEPLTNSRWYANYQGPPGSEHVYLPQCTAELNTWANNFIGAAFLYRARVAWTIGDYSPIRFTTEDYDYWMRVNELMNLRHADFENCLYEYRFHENSLTSKDEDLGITRNRVKLMVFDEFRRSFLLCNSIWVLTSEKNSNSQASIDVIQKKLTERKALIVNDEKLSRLNLPALWIPVIHVHCGDTKSGLSDIPSICSPTAILAILVNDIDSRDNNEGSDFDGFDLIATTDAVDANRLQKIGEDYRGLWSTPSYDDFISLCEVKSKNKQFAAIESRIAEGVKGRFIPLTIVICTYRRSATLEYCLRSSLNQSLSAWEYEIIVVNNDPDDPSPAQIIERVRSEFAHIILPDIRLIDCPIPGLSYARNAGLSEARGENLIFLDDDALAAYDCFRLMKRAFDDNPYVGVIGGHIILRLPNPRPIYCLAGQEALWSQFVTNYRKFTVVDSWSEYPYGALWGIRRNVLCEMGGFRTNFGRIGDDYGGGEEIVAALIARNLGYKIGIEPRAQVIHDVDPSRYSEDHIRKTIMASAVVNYRLHSALYIPYLIPLGEVFDKFISNYVKYFKLIISSLRNHQDKKVELIYASAHVAAQASVLRLKLKDSFDALRKPIVCK